MLDDFKYNKPIDFSDITSKDGFYITANLPGTQAATAANYGVFYIAHFAFQIVWIAESHTTAGTDGSAVELNIEHLTGTKALDDISNNVVIKVEPLLSMTTFNLKGDINKIQERAGYQLQYGKIAKGDRLALKDIGTLTDVAGVQVTLYCKPLNKGHYD